MDRRHFLGAAIVAIPGIRALHAFVPAKVATFEIKCMGLATASITTWANGRISGIVETSGMSTQLLASADNRRTKLFASTDKIRCEFRVEAKDRGRTLDVHSVMLFVPA